jgi:dCMP deaminase
MTFGPIQQEMIQRKAEKQRKRDIWYLNMARYVSTASKDPSTQTGAVIIRADGTPAAFGFNGFPQGMDDSPELYADREVKYSRTVHCEMNAVIFARENLTGATLYTWPFASCDRCAVAMIQAKIERFVYPSMPPDKKARWGTTMDTAAAYMREAGCEVVEIPFEEIPPVVLE